ncbi:type IV pilus biogenesis protein PilM [Staphylospora marina]|uniref:type IV pilus biogenesis protein PilM n=1 Tax=Staphylospora marina TaxID=2490858 RepID=UPI0013DDE239|nr:pilus assembly protein PilM [Staphylospora marina]
MSTVIGIEISPSMFKLAGVKKRGKKLRVHRMVTHPFPSVWMKSPFMFEKEEFVQCVQEALMARNIRGSKVHVAISGRHVVLKRVMVPEMKPSKYRAFVAEHVLPLLDLPFEDPLFDIQPVGEVWFDDDPQELLVALVPRKYVESLTACLRYCGLDPVKVDLAPLALYRWVDVARGVRTPRSLFLGISKSEVEISRFTDGVLKDVRVVSLDMAAFRKEEDRPRPDPLIPILGEGEEVEAYGRSLLDAVMGGIDEWERDAWTRSGTEWFLSGEGIDLYKLEKALKRAAALPVSVAPPAEPYMSERLREKASRWVGASFSVALGLALNGKEEELR